MLLQGFDIIMGKPKGQMRLLAEDWFARNQSHLTQDSFVVQTGNGRIRSRSCQDYYDFVRFNLKDDNGNLLFPEENKTFLVRIVKITQKIRGQHGAIVRANPKITHRNVGDPNSTDSNEQKKYLDFYLDNNPEKKQQYQQTKLIAQQRFRERLKENRKAELGVYKLGAAFEGKLAVNVAELIMKRPLVRSTLKHHQTLYYFLSHVFFFGHDRRNSKTCRLLSMRKKLVESILGSLHNNPKWKSKMKPFASSPMDKKLIENVVTKTTVTMLSSCGTINASHLPTTFVPTKNDSIGALKQSRNQIVSPLASSI